MIIHLGALIYPLPVALNVGLFCEAALRISNEPTAQSVSFSEGAYLCPYSRAGLWANERPYVVFSHRKLQKDFSRSLLTMCYDQIFFKKCQKRTVTANTEPKISCFSSTGTRGPRITILIRCGVMAVMWHVGSAICPSLAIHIITTCCSDSWILSVMRLRGGGGRGAFKLISPLLI